jgi:hypothetical protein
VDVDVADVVEVLFEPSLLEVEELLLTKPEDDVVGLEPGVTADEVRRGFQVM